MQRNVKISEALQNVQVLFSLLAIFFTLRDLFGIPIGTLSILVVNFLMVFLFFALNYLGKEKMLIIVSMLVVVGVGMCLWIGRGFGFFLRLIQYGVSWPGMTGKPNLIYEYILLIIVSFLGYILCSFLRRRLITAAFLPATGVITILIMTFMHYYVSTLTGAINLTLFWQYIYSLHERKSRRNNKTLQYYFPYALLLFLLLFRIPTPQEPYRWPITHMIMNRAETLMYTITSQMGYWEFNSNNMFAGYGDSSRFGGNLLDNDAIHLQIRGSQTHGNFYLRGRYYNICESKQWSSTIPQGNEDAKDMLDWLNALWSNQITKDEMVMLANSLQYEIYYGQLRTDTIFGTLGMFPNNVYPWTDGKQCNDIPMQEGTHYGIRFYEINYQNQDFLKMMDNAEQAFAPYDELAAYTRETLSVSLFDIASEEEYQQYCATRKAEIQNNYLSLPEDIPERVQTLAEEITKNCNNDYEKMQAIVAYVRCYTYSSSIGDSYQKSDCIADTFLFEEKQGYCVHFATTAAILGRCCNIPTRYVSGYLLTYSNVMENNKYGIKGNDAHAWIEAYIEGYGWVRFEPTSAYPCNDLRIWEAPTDYEVDMSAQTLSMEEAEAKRQEEALAAQQYLMEMQALQEKEEREANERAAIIRSFLTPVIMLIIILFLLRLPFQIILHRREYKKAEGELALDKRLYVFERILSKGKRVRKDTETLEEYVLDDWDGNQNAKMFMEQYQKCRYGQAGLSDADRKELDSQLKKMEVMLADGDRWQRVKMWIWIWK